MSRLPELRATVNRWRAEGVSDAEIRERVGNLVAACRLARGGFLVLERDPFEELPTMTRARRRTFRQGRATVARHARWLLARLRARLRRRSPVELELDAWLRGEAQAILAAIETWEARRRELRRASQAERGGWAA